MPIQLFLYKSKQAIKGAGRCMDFVRTAVHEYKNKIPPSWSDNSSQNLDDDEPGCEDGVCPSMVQNTDRWIKALAVIARVMADRKDQTQLFGALYPTPMSESIYIAPGMNRSTIRNVGESIRPARVDTVGYMTACGGLW